MPLKNPTKYTELPSGNPAMRIFLLYRFLKENTNREQVVSREAIFDYLIDNQMEPSKNIFYNDIAFLRDALGMEVVYNQSKKGYQVMNSTFEPSDVRLIVDSIQASKFLTQKKAQELTRAVKENLADKYTRADLNRQAFVADRARSMNDSVINEADRLYKAIQLDSKIQFRYFHYEPNREKSRSYSKIENGNGKWVVSPFALYWNNGYLYLYAYTDDKKDFRYFRIDRMDNISKPLMIPREGKEEFKETNLTGQKSKIFNMYGGKPYDVRMRFFNLLASTVIDEFGSQIMMIPEGDGQHFSITASVQVSPTFYGWLFTLGTKAKILGPAEVVDGFKDYLRNVQQMYEDEGEM